MKRASRLLIAVDAQMSKSSQWDVDVVCVHRNCWPASPQLLPESPSCQPWNSLTSVKRIRRRQREAHLGGVDLALHGPIFGVVLPSSSRSDGAPTATSGFRFMAGTRASSMQNRSSPVLARNEVRCIATLGLLGVFGDAGCCDAFRLALGDVFGWTFGCERTMGLGISSAASQSRCLSTKVASLTSDSSRENGDLAAWCPCTAAEICLMCQGDKSSSKCASSRVSILTDMY